LLLISHDPCGLLLGKALEFFYSPPLVKFGNFESIFAIGELPHREVEYGVDGKLGICLFLHKVGGPPS